MTPKPESEDRALSSAELEIVNATREPEIRERPLDELKSLAKRLRQAHERAKDIGAHQQREMRGKADPRGAKPAQDNTGTKAKAQVLSEALQRLNAELSRREAEAQDGAPKHEAETEADTGKQSQAELSRHALELKLSGQTPSHPGAGRTASQGKQMKERKTPAKIGTTKKEVGRVSQANKVAQARKDAAK